MDDINDDTIKQTAAKSDAELEDCLINTKKFNYIEIALAWKELENRGRTHTKKEKAKIVAIVRKGLHEFLGTPHRYDKDAVLFISLMGTPLFGAILLALNLKSWTQKLEVIGFGVFSAIGLFIADTPGEGIRFFMIYNAIGAAILYTYFWGKFMIDDGYHIDKPVVIPALIVFVIVITLGLLNFNQWRLDVLAELKNILLP